MLTRISDLLNDQMKRKMLGRLRMVCPRCEPDAQSPYIIANCEKHGATS